MDVVTAVTIGLKVLVFLQDLEKNKNSKENTGVAEASRLLLNASEREAEEISTLVEGLDPSILHSLVEGVGGVLGLLSLFKEKK